LTMRCAEASTVAAIDGMLYRRIFGMKRVPLLR
jgi:hypothetical protein